MTTSEQLEREAEQTMVQIADTLAELRDHLTPSRILDDALDYVRDGDGGQLTRNLVRNISRQVVQNPIPTALVGVGIIWLTMAGKHSRSSRVARPATSNDLASAATDRAMLAVAGVSEQARVAKSRLQVAADTAAQTASDAYKQTCTTYGQAISGGRDATRTIRQSAVTAVENTLNSGRTMAAYLRNEPLVLAGLGLALGALIGASLPRSEKEDELMGQSSETLKEGAVKAAKEPWKKGKAVAEKSWEAAKEEAKQQGLAPSRDQ